MAGALDGKVAIVTGAAMGIGRHAAHTLAEAGAKVAVADISDLGKLAAELGERGADVLTVEADVQNEARVKAMVDQVVSHFGRIDILLNNAAIVTHFNWGIPRWPRITDMSKEQWDKVIQTNLGGTFLCTKHVLPHLEAQGAFTCRGQDQMLRALQDRFIAVFTPHGAGLNMLALTTLDNFASLKATLESWRQRLRQSRHRWTSERLQR